MSDSDITTKERFQNPNCGDTIRLRLFSFNSSEKRNVFLIEKIEIIKIEDPTEENLNGEVLIQTINSNEIENPTTGEYYTDITLNEPDFVIGRYIDRWHIQFEDNETCTQNKVNNFFEIVPSMWFTSAGPNIYDFSFKFKPNKITQGSKRYIVIEINPVTPRIESIEKYYGNIAITSQLKINIEKNCGNCPADERETIIEDEVISFREQNLGYYLLDAQEMDEGIYNVWFKLEHGENIYISEKNQLQIFS
jgi:hypothetical protein